MMDDSYLDEDDSMTHSQFIKTKGEAEKPQGRLWAQQNVSASQIEELPKALATAISYTEEEVMQFIKEFEVEWAADNSITTLAFAPKKRSLTPYMLFAY